MKSIYHENQSRGLADHGWLKSRHTFSFANYHNPERMNFGLLRVLNDDIVTPSMGFGTHPHDNMEIISIPLSGSLRHQDSMGNKHIITTGEVQIMSAGSGITHSEYNNSSSEDVNFLQIWVLPKEKDITPRYDQKIFDVANNKNTFQTIVAPEATKNTVLINQDAWFSMADIEADQHVKYEKKDTKNGVYFFVITGNANIEGHDVLTRDGLGLIDGEIYPVFAQTKAQLLAIEVPLINYV
jgi:redox-sensitive bicupin YhaK (pirin superfamily)